MDNLIHSGMLKNIKVHKVKNDKIAMLHHLKVLRICQVPVYSLRGLRLLYRQQAELMEEVTCYKNQLAVYLDQAFPGRKEIFLSYVVPRSGTS